MGGDPLLGRMILFFASPVRTCEDFSALFNFNCLTVSYASFGDKKKKWYRPRHFHGNGHYWTMSQNSFWPPFLIRIFFPTFILMYSFCSTLNQILLKNFFGKVVFQNFGHVTFFKNRNSFFGRRFETKHF